MRGRYLAEVLICSILHGVPWIIDHWLSVPLGWLGIISALVFIGQADQPDVERTESRGRAGKPVFRVPILRALNFHVPRFHMLAWTGKPVSWRRLGSLWLWGAISIGIAFHWSPAAMTYTLSSDYWLGLLVALPLILWDGLRLALGYWLGALLSPGRQWLWLSTACSTIVLEEFMPGVFPWRLGFMQLPWPWWLQAVDIFGAGWSTFLSFAVAGVGCSLVWRIRERVPNRQTTRPARHRIGAATALGLLALNALYSAWSWNNWHAEMAHAARVKLGIIQVDPSHKVSLQQLQELTRQVCREVQLVCWPESSGGTYDLQLETLSDDKRNFELSREPERGLRPWPKPACELLLAGKNYQRSMFNAVSISDSQAQEPLEHLYVSAMLLDNNERITARYHKRYLMPFGEYVPGEGIIPGMAELFDMAEHVTPGDGRSVLVSQCGARLGVMLCYEDMVPQAARDASRQDANILVSLINGSAFESPVTLHQHRLLSHMRALETRKMFVRCAATGQTCVIDACGAIQDSLPLQTNGALISEVPLLERLSMVSRYPHMLVGITLSIVCLFIAVRPWRFDRGLLGQLQSGTRDAI